VLSQYHSKNWFIFLDFGKHYVMSSIGFKVAIINFGSNLSSLIIKEESFGNTDLFGLEPLTSLFLNTQYFNHTIQRKLQLEYLYLVRLPDRFFGV